MRIRRLGLGLSLLLLYQAVAFAQAQVELAAVSPPRQASPGEFVTHVFSIRNRGPADRFLLSLALPPGLEPISPPAVVELETDEEQALFITIFVTAQAKAGENPVQLTATAESDPSITASATAIIIVLPKAGVEVFPPPEAQADPGTTVRLEFVLLNRGNLPDSFKLEAAAPPEVLIKLEQDQLDLLPGEARKVAVFATIPPTAAVGKFRVTLKASSLTNPEVWAEASTWISVLPPPPQAVGGALYAELPATLEFWLEGSPLTKDRALSLDLFAGGRISEETALRLELHLADLFEGLEPGLLFGWSADGDSFFLERAADGLRFDYLGLREAGLKRLELDLWDYFGPPERHDLRLALAQAAEALDLGIAAEVSGTAEGLDGALSSSLGFYLGDSLLRVGLALRGPTLGDQISGDLAFRTGGPGRPALTLSFGMSEENLSQRPAASGITALRGSVSGYHAFGPGLPMIRLRAEFAEQASDGLSPEVNRATSSCYSSLSQPIGQAVLDFVANETRESDRVAGTDYRYSQYEQRLSLRAEGALLSLRLVEELTMDLVARATTDSSFGLETGLTWRVGPLAAALRGAWDEEGLELALRLATEAPSRAWGGAVETIASLPSDGAAELGLALEGLLRFDLPLPFIFTKARVEGYIFIDDDSDGARDPGEPGVSGVFLQIGAVTVRSDSEGTGFYRFPPLWPGRYRLTAQQVPAELTVAVALPIEITLEAGEVLKLDVPLARAGAILGAVFKDLNRNGRREPEEPGLPGVRLVLEANGLELADTYTNSRGEFAFTALLPGRYVLALDPATLPARYEPTTPARVELSLEPGELLQVEFGVAERPRPVVVTFQPPLADFTYVPAEPKSGEKVTFDGSPSFDPDGQIVRYEWDFTGDKAADAEGKVVEWTFPKAGDYPVTLTVTDNDGYTGSVTKTVPVRG